MSKDCLRVLAKHVLHCSWLLVMFVESTDEADCSCIGARALMGCDPQVMFALALTGLESGIVLYLERPA